MILRSSGMHMIVCLAIDVLLLAGCVQHYSPPQTGINYNYLVVDGFINAGNDSTYITLSRTVPLTDTPQLKVETGANVTIQGNNNSSFQLNEGSPGNYSCGPFNPVSNIKYRLHILTASGTEYASDFVTPLYTPPIDSVTWANTQGGVTVYVNTHNNNNSSRYYRWVYYETFEFHPAFESFLNDSLGPRVDYMSIYTCWHTDTSTNILLGSSTNLSENIIYQNPVTFLPDSSWKLGVEYSTFVQQQSIDSNTYSFFQILQNSTEQLGTLFDAQPSSFNGNIQCLSNPANIAIGYIYATSVTTERIFINNNQVPGWYKVTPCEEFIFDLSDLSLLNQGKIIALDYNSQRQVLYTEPACGNCTLSGTNIKPSFWPN
jgi:Domain of unknown function (DUF4249)